MSNIITGDEPVNPTSEPTGETIRQKALLHFMCEIIKFRNPDDSHNPVLVAKIAEDYVTGYINQLNKQP